MNHDPESRAAPRLDPGEQLIWSGAPQQGFMLRGIDAFVIPFSIVWTSFAVFWEASVITSDAPVFFVLWGIPFLVVGAYLVGGRFIVDMRTRANTSYALTDRRVLILKGRRAKDMRSLELRSLADMLISERRDGWGTIAFGSMQGLPSGWSVPAGWPLSDQFVPPQFEMIPDVRRVYDLTRKAQRNAVEQVDRG